MMWISTPPAFNILDTGRNLIQSAPCVWYLPPGIRSPSLMNGPMSQWQWYKSPWISYLFSAIVPCQLSPQPATCHGIHMLHLFSGCSKEPTTYAVSEASAKIWLAHGLIFYGQSHSLYEVIWKGTLSPKLTYKHPLGVSVVRSPYHSGQGGMMPVSRFAVRDILHDQVEWIWTFVKFI
jgi:hypothetical protein